MSDQHPNIRRYTSGGYLSGRDGLSLIFYMKPPHDAMIESVKNVLNIYLKNIEPVPFFVYSDEQGGWQQLDESGWEVIRQELSQPGATRVQLSALTEQAYQYGFTYQGRSLDLLPWEGDGSNIACCVLFWLPTRLLANPGAEYVRKLAVQIAAVLPFYSGHAGLSFNGESDLILGEPEDQALCLRYPGMDISETSFTQDMGPRIDGIHWLNFLGPPVLDELGGIEALRQRLHSPTTTLEELANGRAVVTLGPHPDAGDTHQGRTLPTYQELARVLEPWLYQSPPSPPHLEEVGQIIRRWERRFLEP